MNSIRSDHAAVICGDTVYVMGGHDGFNYLVSCEAYDIAKDEWSYVNSMQIKKAGFSATVEKNKFIYIFGGSDNGRESLDSIERYNIEEDRWNVMMFKLNSANDCCACFCPEPNKVVVLGGTKWKNKVYQLDLRTG